MSLLRVIACIYHWRGTEALEAGDLLREVDGAGGVELVLCGAVGLEPGDLLPESGFKIFELDAGLGGDGALGDAGELERS